MKKSMKGTLLCLVAVMMCSGAFAAATYVWKDYTGDQDFLNMDNWNPPGTPLGPVDTLWIHEGGTSIPQPILTADTYYTMQTIYIGWGDGAGGGRVDLGAGGKMRALTMNMGWNANNTEGHTSVISINDPTSLLHGVNPGSQINVGVGGIDAHLINNNGVISAWDINVGQGTGTGQFDLHGGASWLSGTLNVGANGHVNMTDSAVMRLIGDQVDHVDSLIAGGKLGTDQAGYKVERVFDGDWTVMYVDVIPEPATIGLLGLAGGGLLWFRKRYTI